jgi:hypothetical protein
MKAAAEREGLQHHHVTREKSSGHSGDGPPRTAAGAQRHLVVGIALDPTLTAPCSTQQAPATCDTCLETVSQASVIVVGKCGAALLPGWHLGLTGWWVPSAGSCKHKLCYTCCSSHLKHCVAKQRIPPRCPMPNCGCLLSINLIRNSVGPQCIASLNQVHRLSVIKCHAQASIPAACAAAPGQYTCSCHDFLHMAFACRLTCMLGTLQAELSCSEIKPWGTGCTYSQCPFSPVGYLRCPTCCFCPLQVVSMIPEHLRFSCPYPACGALLQLEEQVSDLPSECPSCHRAVCSSCRSPWHAGLVSRLHVQALACFLHVGVGGRLALQWWARLHSAAVCCSFQGTSTCHWPSTAPVCTWRSTLTPHDCCCSAVVGAADLLPVSSTGAARVGSAATGPLAHMAAMIFAA